MTISAHDVPIDVSGLPAWVATAQTNLDNALSANWNPGQLFRDITFAPAQIPGGFTQQNLNLLKGIIDEYNRRGWDVTVEGTSGTLWTVRFRRAPQ
jgi:hypothetical protein